MEIISDYIDIKDYTTQMAIFATPFVVTGLWYLVRWLFKKPKPDSDTEKEFSARQVSNLLTEQAREIEKKLVEENLENFEVELEKRGNHTGAKKLAEAQEALANNELSKADKLFAEIEAGEELALLKFADVSFARGYIADAEIRWKDAAQHYTRAAEIDPCFETLLRAQRLAYDTGDYNFALSFGLQALKAAIAEYGEKSEQHDIILNNLAGLYTTNKDYHKAELIFNEVLENRTHVLGERHAQIAVTLNNLGTLYREQEQYEKAKPFYEKALDIYEEVFDKNHPYIATTLNNLAELDLNNGEYKKAESRYQRSLNIRLKEFGENHPDTAHGFNNLGGVYCKQGQYKESLPMFQRAIEIVEATLGQEHPQTKLFKRNYELVKKIMANTEKTPPQ